MRYRSGVLGPRFPSASEMVQRGGEFGSSAVAVSGFDSGPTVAVTVSWPIGPWTENRDQRPCCVDRQPVTVVELDNEFDHNVRGRS